MNLSLFELIGRVAMRGLWLVWHLSPESGPIVVTEEVLATQPVSLREMNTTLVREIDRLCEKLVAIVGSNRVLLSPIGDWQAIDIGLAFTLLACRPNCHAAIDEWAQELTKRSIFAYEVHGRYPATSHSYWDLVNHPSEQTEVYRQESTAGSILYPMLALWAVARENQKVVDEIAAFQAKELGHCTFQTWLPDEDSEENIYIGRDNHGSALTGIPVTKGTGETLDFVLAEIASNPHYDALSAVRLGHWPIVLMACRTYRLPVPPQVWRALLLSTSASSGREPVAASSAEFAQLRDGHHP